MDGHTRVTAEVPDPLSDSVQRSDQLLRGTSGADPLNQSMRDFMGPLHWFPVATDRIAGLSLSSETTNHVAVRAARHMDRQAKADGRTDTAMSRDRHVGRHRQTR